MTAVIYHGPPGSYKTFSVVQDVIIPALLEGRVVVTNIRGLDDLDHIERVINDIKKPSFPKSLFYNHKYQELPETAEIISLTHDNDGFKSIGEFFHWVPNGALIVMDEGQRVYPTRLKNLSSYDYPEGKEKAQLDGRPSTLENAFDQHRHHNWDIYITTTNISKIHREIRSVCEYGYKHRDLSGFLPWWKNRWRVLKHDPEKSGASESHAVDGIQRKKADTRYFNVYSSTATGVAQGSAENKNILKNPKLQLYFIIFVIALGYSIGSLTKAFSEKEEVNFPEVSQSYQATDFQGNGLPDSPDSHVNDATRVPVLYSLLETHKITVLGSMKYKDQSHNYYKLTDIETGHISMISSADLDHFGVIITSSGCLHHLEDNNTRITISCASVESANKRVAWDDPGAAMRARESSHGKRQSVLVRHRKKPRMKPSPNTFRG